METGAITNSTLAHATTAAALQNSPREERSEAIDSANEERTEAANSSSQLTESRPELSEGGLKLSANFQNRAKDKTELAIEHNAQAQQIIGQTNNLILQNPGQAGVAQNNLTPDIVKSLLG